MPRRMDHKLKANYGEPNNFITFVALWGMLFTVITVTMVTTQNQ